jgi:hypothetical protein
MPKYKYYLLWICFWLASRPVSEAGARADKRELQAVLSGAYAAAFRYGMSAGKLLIRLRPDDRGGAEMITAKSGLESSPTTFCQPGPSWTSPAGAAIRSAQRSLDSVLEPLSQYCSTRFS